MVTRVLNIIGVILMVVFIGIILKEFFSKRNSFEDKITKELIMEAGVVNGVLLGEYVSENKLIDGEIFESFPGVFASEIGLDIPNKLYGIYKLCHAVGIGQMYPDLGRFNFDLVGVVCMTCFDKRIEYRVKGYLVDNGGNKSIALDSGRIKKDTKVLLEKGKELKVKIVEFEIMDGSLGEELDKELEIKSKAYFRKAQKIDCSDMSEVI